MAEKKTTKAATAAKKETTKKAAAPKKVAKVAEVEINAQNVGFKAGDVYNALAAAEKALTVAELAGFSRRARLRTRTTRLPWPNLHFENQEMQNTEIPVCISIRGFLFVRK